MSKLTYQSPNDFHECQIEYYEKNVEAQFGPAPTSEQSLLEVEDDS